MGKKSSKKKRDKELNRILDIVEGNQFFYTIDSKTFELCLYNDFYFFLMKLIKIGKPIEEAVKLLGFDFDRIGKEFEVPIINHLYELIKDPEYGTRESDFSGTTDEKIFDEFGFILTLEEETAFTNARVMYLRKEVEEKRAELSFLQTLVDAQTNYKSDN